MAIGCKALYPSRQDVSGSCSSLQALVSIHAVLHTGRSVQPASGSPTSDASCADTRRASSVAAFALRRELMHPMATDCCLHRSQKRLQALGKVMIKR
jgi:hypothetical protein